MSTTTNNSPTTYTEAAELLGSRDSLKIGHNTYLERMLSDDIGIRLHATTIVAFLAEGGVILNSGGWQTVTTKERMNRYLPAGVSVVRNKKAWYVLDREAMNETEFSDGMLIYT